MIYKIKKILQKMRINHQQLKKRLPIQLVHFLLIFFTALIELSKPVPPRQQIPVAFRLQIVRQFRSKNLIIPDFHIIVELLDLTVQHIRAKPIRNHIGRPNLVRNLYLKLLQRCHRLTKNSPHELELQN